MFNNVYGNEAIVEKYFFFFFVICMIMIIRFKLGLYFEENLGKR